MSEYSASHKYKGDFVWSQTSGIFTKANYEIWKARFKDVFIPEDIRMFLALKNREGKDKIDFLLNWYNQFLGKYKPYGVDLEGFVGITDLRIK